VSSLRSDDDPVVVVGGGAAGHSCIAAYREHGGDRSLVLVTADDRLPYFRPHLTKDVLIGRMSFDEIELDDEGWYASHDVEVHRSCGANGIDLTTRTLATDDGPLRFGDLVLATGSGASMPDLPGADDDRVVTVRTAGDAHRLLDLLGGDPVLVIGSGFVGCEIAASLRLRGLTVSMATNDAGPQHDRLGPDVAELVGGWLHDLGVTLHTGVTAQRIDRGDGVRVHFDDGTTRDAAVVVVATGAHPNTELASTAGLARDGAVDVDASMRTRAPGVLAIGDIARAWNPAAGRALRVEHWGDAEAMGAIAGSVLAGVPAEWTEVPGFWSVIAGRELKYVAWGDGWDRTSVRRSAEGITVSYGLDGEHVGVLTYLHDDDLAPSTALIASHATFVSDVAHR
jgi:NADPH-dependent 2,4-dienoyl-CoA reductase/sulfur reductase-like enzyme